MKKRFIVFIFLLLVCAGACGCKHDDVVPNSTTGNDSNITQTTNNSGNGQFSYAVVDMEYVPFEQVIENCTNIVKAKYIKTVDCGTHYEQLFEVQRQYKGNLLEKQIHVRYEPNIEYYVMNKGYSYTARNDYIPGKSYVLLLACKISVYKDYPVFTIQSGIYIPVENASASCVYGVQPLHEHIALNYIEAQSFSKIENYIVRECAACSSTGKYYGMDYIRSSDLRVIINNSPYILRVKPVSFVMLREDNQVERYKCQVIATYKGTVASTEIEVDFFAETVEIGAEYIVALTDSVLSNLYKFSAKDSLISVEQQNQILQILDLN